MSHLMIRVFHLFVLICFAKINPSDAVDTYIYSDSRSTNINLGPESLHIICYCKEHLVI